MLLDHSTIYIKPNDSCRGKGILRIDQHHHQYILRSRDTNHTMIHNHFNELWSNINRLKRKRHYILQQGIESITQSGKHFDIRIHMTRARGKWHIAGMIGNIARQGGIITTESSGGTCTYVHQLLENHLGHSPSQTAKTIEKLQSIALQATSTISKKYPTWSEFGLDIGIDPKQHIWIFEINITPGALVFQKLDKKIFQRVLMLRKMAR